MREKAVGWVEMSDYDFDTARALFSVQRYMYIGLMCHRTIEAILKAYWCNVLEEPLSEVRHLGQLAGETGIIIEFSEDQIDFIDELEPLNRDVLNPSDRERLMKALTPNYCKELLTRTSALRQWVKSRL